MRGTKAKALRRKAQSLTVGNVATSYDDIPMGVKQCGTTTDGRGGQVPYMVRTIQRRLKLGCTRKVYKELKHEQQ